MQYCDGSMHSGARTSASDETFGLWFSGHHTIAATIDHLSRHTGLNASAPAARAGGGHAAQQKTHVVFSGGSAGGVGVFSNFEYVQAVLPHATVLGAPIGGFVPEIHWFTGAHHTTPPDDLRTPAFRRLVELYQSYLPEACVRAMGADAYKCELPHFSYPHLTVPVFIIEAITDSVVLGGFEGVSNANTPSE